MPIAKYAVRYVEIVYQSADGRLTQRTIFVHSVRAGIVRAFCTTSGAPKDVQDRILAVRPARRSA